MQIRVSNNDDGTSTVIVKRTRKGEGPTQVYSRIKPEEVEAALADGVKKVADPALQPAPTG